MVEHKLSPFALAAMGLWPCPEPSRHPIQLRHLGPAASRIVTRLLGEGLIDIFTDEGQEAICWSAVNSYLAAGSDLEPED